MSFRLNEVKLISEAMEAVPIADGEAVCTTYNTCTCTFMVHCNESVEVELASS